MASRKPFSSIRALWRRHPLDAVFWGLLCIALIVGSGGALAGLPLLVGLFLPTPDASGQPATIASATFSHPIAAPSRYAPQVLQPVSQSLFPDWLRAGHKAPAAKSPASAAAKRADKPQIAIVIDDMGGDVAQSRRAIELPAAITLSFLPYPDQAPALSRAAHREGHEVLVHVPMQPLGDANPGPNALDTGLDAAANRQRLEWDLSRIEGYDGINNHEGSKFTSNRAALDVVMGVLSERHLFFLDSRTSPDTQVVSAAQAAHVESAGRDVFLDNIDKPDAIDAQLQLTEKIARKNGVAIAIGHPRVNTIDALWRWSGELQLRGFVLVPVRDAIRRKLQSRDLREAALGRH